MSVGSDGWVRVGELGEHSLFVRLVTPGVIGELFLAADTPQGITAADLRSLPLARIAAVASDCIAQRESKTAPVPDVRAELGRAIPPRRYVKPVRPTLRPPRSRLDDDFLRSVADAYMASVRAGEWPNKALAKQARVEIRTIERWVYLTRKRGFLPATRAGSIG